MSRRSCHPARLVAFAVALLAIAAPIGISGPARGAALGGCGAKVVFLVWPHGHPAIPSIAEFPRIPNPHVELYRTFTSGYDIRYAGAWVIGGKPPAGITRGGFLNECVNYGDTVTTGTIAHAQVITTQTAVKCVLPGSPVTDVVLRAGGVADMYVHSGKQLLAQAHVTKTSARLTLPRTCTRIAPPHP